MTSQSTLLEPQIWKDLTFLVVEDEITNYLFIEAALERSGVKIVWAKDGRQGVDACKQNPLFDLVLMDIKLPVLNGCEATKIIKAINSSIPIIALTAYALTGQKEDIIDCGCDDYLAKPIRQQVLLSTIIKWINP